ncbi:MAG TPA: hypothetical protein VII38_20540 [Polyangia bacterium]
MRALGIVFAVGTIGLGVAALRGTSSAQAEDRVVAQRAAAVESSRDREDAERTRVASAIVHASGPVPFGMVPATAPAEDPLAEAEAEDDRCPTIPSAEEQRDDGCPDPAIVTVDGRQRYIGQVELDVETVTDPQPLESDERIMYR